MNALPELVRDLIATHGRLCEDALRRAADPQLDMIDPPALWDRAARSHSSVAFDLARELSV